MKSRHRLAALASVLLLIESAPTPIFAATLSTDARPNIVVIMTDDQDVTKPSLEVMPHLQRLLVRKGVTFTNSFTNNPLCCPSRASLLTGQTTHNHGVYANLPPLGGYPKLDHSNTLAVWLHRAGYKTAIIGKHLNAYGQLRYGVDPHTVPPGWTTWLALITPPTYYDYAMNQNGKLVFHGRAESDYLTDVLTGLAVSFIQQNATSSDPFCLWVSYFAPHDAPDGPETVWVPNPAPRHRTASVPGLELKPSFNEADVSDKPAGIRRLPRLPPDTVKQVRERYQQRLRSLLAVDEGVDRIMSLLETVGKLDNSFVFFVSDNGMMNGEHRWYSKSLPYEESIRVPLIVRGRGIPQGEQRVGLVTNVDWAPTIMELTGVSPGLVMDGRSLLSLIKDARAPWRTAILLDGDYGSDRRPYSGLRTATLKYIEYKDSGGERELYFLDRDPFELENKVTEPANRRLVRRLAEKLLQLRTCHGDGCWVADDLDSSR